MSLSFFKFFFIIIILFFFSCHSNIKKPNTVLNKTDTTVSFKDTNIDRYTSEKVYALCQNKSGNLSDELIEKICNLKIAHEATRKIDKIYTSGRELKTSAFRKLFFRKYTDGSGIQAGFLYNFAGADYYFEVEWFTLLGNKDVVSVFNYSDDPEGRWSGEIVVILSKDEENHYYTDILTEDCGQLSCEMGFLYEEDSVYKEQFKQVKSYGDFVKNYKNIKKKIQK